MAVLKCKMCGGNVTLDEKATVGSCQYCGTKQTFSATQDERRREAFNEACDLRRNNLFDRARQMYQNLVAEDETDAEGYWSLVLCRFGIEYVEDPRTHRRIPTVNRVQLGSIFDDPDYLKALEHADSMQRMVYEDEAQVIDRIQQRILRIARSEEPYDVFICYKETDENGNRTRDSVYAQDIYQLLTKEGYRVFFSRITLEDKLGVDYEPYIFAALQSARVMVVVGTCREHFEAVWVKNEWSRYLTMLQNDDSKTLIPAYRGMDAYDLPSDFSYLQALNMENLGFMQDLIHGIQKILSVNTANRASRTVFDYQPAGSTSTPGNVKTFLEQAEDALEKRQYASAAIYSNDAIQADGTNVTARFYLLLAKCKVNTLEQLATTDIWFEGYPAYHELYKHADEELKSKLHDVIKAQHARMEKSKQIPVAVRANRARIFLAIVAAAIFLIFFSIMEDPEDIMNAAFFCSLLFGIALIVHRRYVKRDNMVCKLFTAAMTCGFFSFFIVWFCQLCNFIISEILFMLLLILGLFSIFISGVYLIYIGILAVIEYSWLPEKWNATCTDADRNVLLVGLLTCKDAIVSAYKKIYTFIKEKKK